MSTRQTIYLPEPLAARFDKVAKAHNLNASQFHQQAGTKFADELEAADLTEQIDAALDEIGPMPVSDAPARRLIADGGWEW